MNPLFTQLSRILTKHYGVYRNLEVYSLAESGTHQGHWVIKLNAVQSDNDCHTHCVYHTAEELHTREGRHTNWAISHAIHCPEANKAMVDRWNQFSAYDLKFGPKVPETMIYLCTPKTKTNIFAQCAHRTSRPSQQTCRPTRPQINNRQNYTNEA
jgi:hypothetical protein